MRSSLRVQIPLIAVFGLYVTIVAYRCCVFKLKFMSEAKKSRPRNAAAIFEIFQNINIHRHMNVAKNAMVSTRTILFADFDYAVWRRFGCIEDSSLCLCGLMTIDDKQSILEIAIYWKNVRNKWNKTFPLCLFIFTLRLYIDVLKKVLIHWYFIT